MDELVLNRPLTTTDLMTMANRELSAFFSAVADLFGPEQAEQSAEDWLQELTASRDLPASTGQWRTLTITAASRLAGRVSHSKTRRHPEQEKRR